MANPYYVNPAVSGAIGRGLGAIGQGITASREQEAAEQKQGVMFKEVSGALESGDPNQISSMMLKYPEAQKRLEAAQGFRSEATKQKRIESLMRIRQGEPAGQVAAETAEFIAREGGTPDQTLAFANLPPEQARRMADEQLAMLLPADQFKNLMSASGSMSEADSQKLNLEREKIDMRKLENEQRALDRQLNRETNELKRQEIQGRIDERKVKLDEKKQNISTALDKKQAGVKSTQRLIDDMLAHPGLDSAVGLSSVFPTIPGGDAADYEVMLETLKSQQFLNEIQQMKGMGALSNAEGQKISAAAEALSLSQSEAEHRKALKRITEGLKTIAEPGTYGGQAPATSGQTNTVNWADM